MSDALRAKLAGEIANVPWRDLRPHAARGALFLVADAVGLLEAAVAIARDDTASVETWVGTGQLVRPDTSQLQAWERDTDRPFEHVIVQPFVLARALDVS